MSGVVVFLLAIAANTPAKHGCVELADRAGWYACDGGAIRALGCAALRWEPALDGLMPAARVWHCDYVLPALDDPNLAVRWVPGVRGTNGSPLGPPTIAYCLLTNNGSGFELIGSADDFVARFAPVESPDEAMAFVAALSHLERIDQWRLPHGFKWMVEEKPTFSIETVEGGYVIRNLVASSFGCEIEPSRAVTVKVTREGKLLFDGVGTEIAFY